MSNKKCKTGCQSKKITKKDMAAAGRELKRIGAVYATLDDHDLAKSAGITVKELRAHRKAEDMEGKAADKKIKKTKVINRQYKVWVQIEELTDDGEPTKNDLPVLPDSIGNFSDLKDAMKQVARVVHAFGSDKTIETSDSVAGMRENSCKKCATDLDDDGHCTDITCPYSDRDQDDIFIEG